MANGLPPLNALRAFDAAARHLSFTLAAAELHVTQAAISHQIKALEQSLGIALFRRANRRLALSEAGQAYLPAVRQAFDALVVATARLRAQDSRGRLTLSTLSSFAARWLVPRLGKFMRAHPEIDLRISPGDALVNFRRDDVDVAIRYGRGRYPGLHSVRLMTEDLFPVCSPRLLAGPTPLRAPEDLRRHLLLHDDNESGWRNWLLAAGVDGIDLTRGPLYTDSGMLIEAAINGDGVALARGALARDALASGKLRRPFHLRLPAEYAYYFVCPEESAERPRVVALRDWLVGEAAAERGLDAQA